MVETGRDACIDAVRRFNRFYTRQIGVLDERLLGSPFSLTEARVLYELANGAAPTSGEIGRDLGLDAGYLSRIVRRFEKHGLVEKQPSATDRRQSHLRLTAAGRDAFAPLDARSREQVSALLNGLPAPEQRRLVEAMRVVERLLAKGTARPAPLSWLLRPPRVGDMGWVVHRHGVLYSEEYGWDERFEALVADVVASFVQEQDPRLERCWIAEADGEIVGSVFLVARSESVAKLRLLLVEPAVRGLGIGTRLVRECVRFAREAGYARITLWTNSVLLDARRLYERAGFRLVREEPHRSFGHDLVGETWELEL